MVDYKGKYGIATNEQAINALICGWCGLGIVLLVIICAIAGGVR